MKYSTLTWILPIIFRISATVFCSFCGLSVRITFFFHKYKKLERLRGAKCFQVQALPAKNPGDFQTLTAVSVVGATRSRSVVMMARRRRRRRGRVVDLRRNDMGGCSDYRRSHHCRYRDYCRTRCCKIQAGSDQIDNVGCKTNSVVGFVVMMVVGTCHNTGAGGDYCDCQNSFDSFVHIFLRFSIVRDVGCFQIS